MSTLFLTPETVDAYTQLISEPEKHGLDFLPLKDCIKQSDKVTALHILFKNYIDLIKRDVPKVIFYIIIQNIYGNPSGVDENGNAGYNLKIIDTSQDQ